MDRQEFASSIKCKDLKEPLSSFFDESMALYELINQYKVDIITAEIHSNPSTVEFIVDCFSEDDAFIIGNNIKEKIVEVYGIIYSLAIDIDKDKINIFLNKR